MARELKLEVSESTLIGALKSHRDSFLYLLRRDLDVPKQHFGIRLGPAGHTLQAASKQYWLDVALRDQNKFACNRPSPTHCTCAKRGHALKSVYVLSDKQGCCGWEAITPKNDIGRI